MELSAHTESSEWQSGHVPRLAHRNATDSEERYQSDSNSDLNDRSSESTPRMRTSIRQIRQSMPVQSPPLSHRSSFTPVPATAKKKSSILGGLFTKEPTQVALNQVAAQMIAQHGSTSATKVPNVSMTKMPKNVPKVNSKWDGIPDPFKAKEKREKDRVRSTKRRSLTSAHGSSSTDSGEHRGKDIYSQSTNSSDDSYEKISHSSSHHEQKLNDLPVYAYSTNSSGDLASRNEDETPRHGFKVTEIKRTHRSPSDSSLPEIMAFFPLHIQNTSSPTSYRSNLSSRTYGSSSSNNTRVDGTLPVTFALSPTIDAVPEHTSSPATTPRDASPVTPSPYQGQGLSCQRTSFVSAQKEEVVLTSSGHDIIGPPITAKKHNMKPLNSGFLAGEAKPLELPDNLERTAPGKGGFQSQKTNKSSIIPPFKNGVGR